jgi:hypothetical protein
VLKDSTLANQGSVMRDPPYPFGEENHSDLPLVSIVRKRSIILHRFSGLWKPYLLVHVEFGTERIDLLEWGPKSLEKAKFSFIGRVL